MAGRIIGAFVAVAVGAIAINSFVNKDETPVAEAEPVTQATVRVVRVIDGDTLVVNHNSRDETIRLLNVDTPETKDPNTEVECLGPEATEFLENRLKPGAAVTLEYDTERTDRYGRTLAAVYESGSLVNADIARAGFGVAVTFEPNHKFYAPVREAQTEAEKTRRGLFSPVAECTLPAQVGQAKNALHEAQSVDPSEVDELTRNIDELERAVDLAVDVRRYVEDDTHFPTAVLAAAYTKEYRQDQARTLSSMIDEAKGTKRQREKKLTSARAARTTPTPAAAPTTIDEEATSRPTSQSTRTASRPTAVRSEQKKDISPARTTKITNPAPARTTKPAPQPTKAKTTDRSKGNGNPYPGYNGPRCYAPGGKTWKPC